MALSWRGVNGVAEFNADNSEGAGSGVTTVDLVAGVDIGDIV